jgi:hypothetical protein
LIIFKLDNEVVNKIEKLKANEKDVRWVQDRLTQVEKRIQRRIKKEDKAVLNQVWSTVTIKIVTGEHFHNNFRARF